MNIDMQAGLDEFEKNLLAQLSNWEDKYGELVIKYGQLADKYNDLTDRNIQLTERIIKASSEISDLKTRLFVLGDTTET